MADTLARIHALPLPAAGSPIPRQQNPFLETLAAIEQNAMRFLDKAVPDPDARAEIAEELRLMRGMAPAFAQRAQPLTVALADTHPGNFIVDRDGIAWFVDLEKVHVGSPAIDLAHATLATSTLWHPDVGKVLSRDEVQRFYTLYLEKVGRTAGRKPRTMAAADAPADLASNHAFHGSMACADAQPARSVGPHTMERRRPGAGDEGAHRSAHRPMLSPRHDSIDPSRMDGLTRSLFVLRVGRTMRPKIPPDYPDDAIAEPVHHGRGALSERVEPLRQREAHPHDRRLGDRGVGRSRRKTTSCRRCARR